MNGQEFALTYNFSCDELKTLASLFRERQDKIPRSLYNFSRAVQDKVYACMSIDEVEEGCKHESR